MLNFIFPKSCVICQRLGGYLCDLCQQKLVVIGTHSCSICGIPFKGSSGSHPCSRCLSDKPYYDCHRALFQFDENSQKIIHGLKYNAQFFIRNFITNYFEGFKTQFSKIDLVVPVPLHKTRLRKRGFNQSQLLGEIWSRVLDKKNDVNNLVRIKNNPTQTGLNKKQRKINLKDAFAIVDPVAFAEKKILLVDDVHTTGVTLNAAAKALKDSGAKKVLATTLAIV